ncbi:hypothetical protein [Nocardia callitridis]|uniref:DUF2188 domain-containing protein n=1 Tax=Nocardia callitridis TaxID=648753 RepID=A0ABP9K1K1_9NOCA
MIMSNAVRDDVLATKEYVEDGVPVWVVIGRPEPHPTGAGWRCGVRVERGDVRFEQSQVVAPSEKEVLRLALELVTTRLGMTETQFFDDVDTETTHR